jgi:hypothetical protein
LLKGGNRKTPAIPFAILGGANQPKERKIVTTLQIKCPLCHGILFDDPVDPESTDDLAGHICGVCGHALTHEDIKRQVEEYAAAHLEKILKDKGT